MNSRVILLFVVLAHGIVPAALGAVPPWTNDIAMARSQASNSLAAFKVLITPANYQLMGFHSTNEVLQATNAEPLLIYTVPLNKLRDFIPGQDFESLLEPAPKVIVPILVSTNVRSSTTLRLVSPGGGPGVTWTTENWGQPKLIRELRATYGTITNTQLSPGTLPFAVEIPVVDIWLIGYSNILNQLILRSTVDMRLGPVTIPRHQIVTDAAMSRLAAAAQRYNGLPN